MRSALLCLLLTAFAPTLFAQALEPTWHLSAQIYSFHPNSNDPGVHNTTPGLGVIRRRGEWLTGLGIFRNSVGRWAGYGYLGWQRSFYHTRAGAMRFGAIGGLTHHYNYNNGGIVPLAAAVLTVPITKSVDVDLIGIPQVGDTVYSALNFSLSWRFK